MDKIFYIIFDRYPKRTIYIFINNVGFFKYFLFR